jgi:hypothetical protein
MLLTVMPGLDLRELIVVNADCIADAAMQAASRLLQFVGQTNISLAQRGAQLSIADGAYSHAARCPNCQNEAGRGSPVPDLE